MRFLVLSVVTIDEPIIGGLIALPIIITMHAWIERSYKRRMRIAEPDLVTVAMRFLSGIMVLFAIGAIVAGLIDYLP